VQETPYNRDEPYEPWNRCLHFGPSELRALITSSGVVQVKRYCPDCGRHLSGALSHQGIDVDALPVHADYRRADAPCERCKSTLGVELHHWAPRHLFEDAESWPMAYLCVACHQEWHRIVTPRMTERRAS
jgi:hypothetical protein